MFSILRPNYKPISSEIREIIRRSTDKFCHRKLNEAKKLKFSQKIITYTYSNDYK